MGFLVGEEECEVFYGVGCLVDNVFEGVGVDVWCDDDIG